MPTVKNLRSYAALIKDEVQKHGLVVDDSELEKFASTHPNVLVADKNHPAGHVFAHEIHEEWKQMKFKDKMALQIHDTRKDKNGLMRKVREYHKEKAERIQAENEAYFNSLSPLRQ